LGLAVAKPFFVNHLEGEVVVRFGIISNLQHNFQFPLPVDTRFFKQFGEAFTPRKIKVDEKVVVFLFFLFFASFLWYLNKLNHEYTIDLSYPVRFSNLPSDKVFVKESEAAVTLKVRAHGYTLLKFKMSSVLAPLNIDLKEIKLNRLNGSKTTYYILSSRIQTMLADQINPDMQLEEVAPDTLFVDLSHMSRRVVPVQSNLDPEPERQFMLSRPPTLHPDSVIVTGPASLVDTLAFWPTKPKKLDKLNQSTSGILALTNISGITPSTRRIDYTITVEKYTEGTVDVPIQVVNVPANKHLMLLPATAKVSYMVALSRYTEVTPSSFKLVVDYSNVSSLLSDKLKVSLTGQPDFVASITVNPNFVEYIVQNN